MIDTCFIHSGNSFNCSNCTGTAIRPYVWKYKVSAGKAEGFFAARKWILCLFKLTFWHCRTGWLKCGQKFGRNFKRIMEDVQCDDCRLWPWTTPKAGNYTLCFTPPVPPFLTKARRFQTALSQLQLNHYNPQLKRLRVGSRERSGCLRDVWDFCSCSTLTCYLQPANTVGSLVVAQLVMEPEVHNDRTLDSIPSHINPTHIIIMTLFI